MFFLWGGCPLAVTCSSHSSLFRAVCYLFSNSPASHERLAPGSQISSFLKGGLLLALKFSSVFRAVCSLCSVRLGEGFSWSWIHGEVEQNACAGEKEVSDPVHIGGEAIRPCAGRRVCFGLCPCMLMLEKLFRACPGQRNSLSDSSQKTPYGDKKKPSPTFGGGGGTGSSHNLPPSSSLISVSERDLFHRPPSRQAPHSEPPDADWSTSARRGC